MSDIEVKEERVEPRNVGMYPSEWEAVDRAAAAAGLVTARGPNTSQMLRAIVRKWLRIEAAERGGESCGS